MKLWARVLARVIGWILVVIFGPSAFLALTRDGYMIQTFIILAVFTALGVGLLVLASTEGRRQRRERKQA